MRRHSMGSVLVVLASLAAIILATSSTASASSGVMAVYRFQGVADGFSPMGLVADAAGHLYGTTYQGGSTNNCFRGCGTVYELTPAPLGQQWKKKILHLFMSNGIDGYAPTPTLFMDGKGDLFGTTFGGGSGNGGIVYELVPPAVRGGRWTQKIIFNFTFANNGAGGYSPGGLIFDISGSGNLFGTTSGGGAFDGGTIFELIPSGHSWTETVLHSFDRQANSDPPGLGLAFDSNGNLYGTRSGMFGVCTPNNPVYCGVLFQFHHPYKPGGSWIYNIIHRFQGSVDDWFPNYPVVVDASGEIFGTASAGGGYTFGAVFQFVPMGNNQWGYYSPHDFGTKGDGLTPIGTVTLGAQGTLFGSTSAAVSGNGTVYKLTPPGVLGGIWAETILTTFPDPTQGVQPNDQLVFGKDGALYGTTVQGGSGNCSFAQLNGCGVVFRIAP